LISGFVLASQTVMSFREEDMYYFMTILLLVGCATSRPQDKRLNQSRPAVSPQDSAEMIPPMTKTSEDGRIDMHQSPCERSTLHSRDDRPEIKVGVKKKLGADKKKLFLEYGCDPAHD